MVANMTYILKRFPTLLLYNLNSESNSASKVTCLVSLLFWFHSRLNFKDFPTLLKSNKRLLVCFKKDECKYVLEFLEQLSHQVLRFWNSIFKNMTFWITNTRRPEKGRIKWNHMQWSEKCSSAMKEFFLI